MSGILCNLLLMSNARSLFKQGSLIIFVVVILVLISIHPIERPYPRYEIVTQHASLSTEEPEIKRSTLWKLQSANYRTNFSGPMVRGWEPWVDRNVSLYIRPNENTILTNLSCLDLSNTQVLILVKSAPTMVTRRAANRQTWMADQKSYPRVKTLFVFGTENGTNASVQREAAENCDIVQMDFVDSYLNVTLDAVSALKFAQSSTQFSNGKASHIDFVVVADDDTYINIPNLWDRLYKEDLKRTSQVLVGHLFRNNTVLRYQGNNGSKIEKRTKTKNVPKYVGRLEVPKYMVGGKVYPEFLCGMAYIVPYDMLDCLYQACLNLPLFHIDDVFVTGFAAQRCGFDRIHDERFSFPLTRDMLRASLRPDLIAVHNADGVVKVFLNAALNRRSGIGSKTNWSFANHRTIRLCDNQNVNCSDIEMPQ